ncbi:MotA/TolQ/ExbB proton channel family protein [Algibacter pectinivorans]|uniref:MotA/TolQ/ExbB proton channel family protein n=1 Tax=Algibacter pectinivorans TaxID=870482 RepID=A0A1I1P2C0_9FLAO|nr:MotA/TolQ/ExbB proton channel family protein [Algibacter pectinivorans]SFD04094.1 MotA/TolQ/ExbB proton channel family protein [Algibacter pectinivorans]
MFMLSVVFLNVFVDRFMEGGPLFMSLILICLLLAIAFLVMGFVNLKKDVLKSKKMTKLASDVSILGLVFGFLGSTIGMITAFDAIESIGGISQGMMAAGLKVAFLTTVFGCITFILPRIGIIILRGLQKG